MPTFENTRLTGSLVKNEPFIAVARTTRSEAGHRIFLGNLLPPPIPEAPAVARPSNATPDLTFLEIVTAGD